MSGLVQLEQALIECPVGSNAGFEFIACGQELRDPISLYGNDRVVETLDMLRAEYEVVLIDLPALIEHSETGVMLNRCDGVLLFVRAGSDAQELATVRRRLEVLTRGERGVVFQYGSS